MPHPYHEAAAKNDTTALQPVLTSNTPVDVRDQEGATLLFVASGSGHVELVKRLLAVGARVNARNSKRWTSIHAAAKAGKDDVISVLLSAGADVNRQNVRRMTPLMMAAQHNQIQCAERLIGQSGCDVDLRDMYSRTAMHWAIKGKSLQIVRLLEQKGASLKVTDSFRKTLIFQAVKSRAVDILEYLLRKLGEEGRELMQKEDTLRRQPIHYASRRGGGIIEIEMLLKWGGSIDDRSTHGKTALMFAAEGAQLDTVKYLLEEGADPNLVDRFGSSALIYVILGRLAAREPGSTSKPWAVTAWQLIKYNADMALQTRWSVFWLTRSEHYQHALELATKGGYQDFVTMLLLAGSEVRNLKTYFNLPTESLPHYLQKNVAILEQVRQFFTTEPASLKALCRNFVRKILLRVAAGLEFRRIIAQLALPSGLVAILFLDDVEKSMKINEIPPSKETRSRIQDGGAADLDLTNSAAEYEVSTFDSDTQSEPNVVDSS